MRLPLTLVLFAGLAFGQSAPAPHRVQDWRVLPEPRHHDHSKRTKIILVVAGAVGGAVLAWKTSPHCSMKMYDGRPYSGVNVPCPKEK